MEIHGIIHITLLLEENHIAERAAVVMEMQPQQMHHIHFKDILPAISGKAMVHYMQAEEVQDIMAEEVILLERREAQEAVEMGDHTLVWEVEQELQILEEEEVDL